jgi:cation transport ATPase
MNGVKERLDSREGVHHVRLNNATGSITVRYDHDRHSTQSVLGLLEDLDTVFQSLGHEAEMASPEGEVGEAFASAGFVEALNDLNRRIYGTTGIPVNLKILMPLLFAGAGLWSISRRGLMIEAVPGWLFLWFAFDMFVKLHPSENAQTD